MRSQSPWGRQLMPYIPGQKVELEIVRETDLGFVARINDGKDEGLLYRNEIFEVLRRGQKLSGYIARVREDGLVDLLLQPLGNLGAKDLGAQILEELKRNNGSLNVNSDSPAEEIYDLFGVSKKKFKIALGGLYKKRLVIITDDGIKLV